MSLEARQMLVSGVIGLVMMLVVVRLSRRGQLSFRYTFGWIAVASFGILAGFFVPLVEPAAESLGLSPAALLGLGALLFVAAIAIQLSISISGLQRNVQTLTEEIAQPSSGPQSIIDLKGQHTCSDLHDQAAAKQILSREISTYGRYGLAVIVTLVALLVVWPILNTPLVADDALNAGLRRYLVEQPGALLANLRSHIVVYTRQWMNAEGRFFPVSVIYTSAVHLIFQGVGLYKMYLALLGVTNAYLLYRVCSKTLNPFSGSIVSLTFLATYTMRYQQFHDGITSFSGLIPFTLLMLLLSMNLIIGDSSRHKIHSALALLCWILASLAYEHVATFVIGILGFCWVFAAMKRRRILIVGFALVTFTQFLFTAYLRNRASAHLNWAYQLQFGRGEFFSTLRRQFVAAIPGSQLAQSGRDISQLLASFSLTDTMMLIIIVALLILLLIWSFFDSAPSNGASVSPARTIAVALLGLNMWLAPAVITGATPRWQTELPAGQGYLCVTLQSAGFALLIAALLSRRRQRSWIWQGPVIVLLPLAVLTTIAWNWSYN